MPEPHLHRTTIRALIACAAVAAGVALAACASEDVSTRADKATGNSDTTADSQPADAPSTPSTTTSESPCGVTLAEVQAMLPPTSGVTESSTPDPGRCNFTWDDGGPRGIDVAIVPRGRSAFEVPAGYEPLDGYGDEAFGDFAAGRANAFAFVGDDLYAADVIADGTGTDDAVLRDLCLRLLDLILD